MQIDVTAIVEAALKLPEGDRLAIVSRLLETVPAEQAALALDDPNLMTELDRRMNDTENSVPWSELRAEQ
jgi:putative addiction module component (TIGR02574 family)